MFSPASSGRVHIFATASRALLACSVHIPGSPPLSTCRGWIGDLLAISPCLKRGCETHLADRVDRLC